MMEWDKVSTNYLTLPSLLASPCFQWFMYLFQQYFVL